ncbi:hypothetical protein CAL12_23095 [Bordetella genomosp. 8]|uniref:Uncharacterized protein n=1 Tax=Bordetella genomosp. 8 TaxID=1416806 RepID=A0A1W6YQY5_9BORD|nr:hypothetical protein [Bordetella genomosp. 8]ARP83418.1 hypothetical protein CAL12_23095 [Bordetella genomosp. 8]
MMTSSRIPHETPLPAIPWGFLRLLAGLGGCVLAGALLGWPGDAHADTPPAGNLSALRQKLVPANVQQCRSLLQRTPELDPYAPKSSTAWEGYCSCVGQAYVGYMPDNVVLAFASGKLPQDRGDQAARMRAAAVSLDAARARCAAVR